MKDKFTDVDGNSLIIEEIIVYNDDKEIEKGTREEEIKLMVTSFGYTTLIRLTKKKANDLVNRINEILGK